MIAFFKTLFKSLYDVTIGGAVRLYHNAKAGTVDRGDQVFIGRTVTYVGLVALSFVAPGWVAVIGILRVLCVIDFISMIGDVFRLTANRLSLA